jgi:4'-phosphopantetheinyl transferase EntD
MWRDLLPKPVVVVCANAGMWSTPPSKRESLLVERAVAARKREFQAGRAAARAALRELGIEGHDLLAGSAREPLWPPGIVGSISHKGVHCVAAVARVAHVLAIGLDVEEDDPLREEVIPLVCTKGEREALRGLGARSESVWAKLLFSAKESFYKSYYPSARRVVAFHDVSVSVYPDRNEFCVQLASGGHPASHSRPLIGRYAFHRGFVLTALVVRADPA